MTDTNDPRLIGLDIASTFVVVSKFLRGSEEPFTSEDARAMSISAHMEASKRGYKNLHPPPKEEPNVAQEPQRPSQEASSVDTYDYHNMKHIPSVPSIGLLKGVMKDAQKKETDKGLSVRDAETEVKKTIIEAFEKEWKFTPNLVAPKGHLNQGQVSWTIDFIKTEWGLE